MRFLLLIAVFCSAALTSYSQIGKFFGTTPAGSGNSGKVFTVRADGSELNVVKAFSLNAKGDPDGPNGLIADSDGNFYGIASKGGKGQGVLFKVSATTLAHSTLYEFNLDPSSGVPTGELAYASNGYIYGVATKSGAFPGQIFRVKNDGTDFSFLSAFAAGNTFDVRLTASPDGNIYGISPFKTGSFGELFQIDQAGNFTSLLIFDGTTTGRQPRARVLEASNGSLYGVTNTSGSTQGTIFKVEKNGTGYQTLYTFGASEDLRFVGQLAEFNGDLYGVAASFQNAPYLFKIKLNGTDFTVVYEFGSEMANPTGPLTPVNGNFIGTMQYDYLSGNGSLFSVKADGTGFRKLTAFPDPTIGASPTGPLLSTTNGYVVGLCIKGGIGDLGTLFKVKAEPETGESVVVKLTDFYTPIDGHTPAKSLFLAPTGDVIGSTQFGGNTNRGVLFRMNPDGTNYNVIFNFDDVVETGANPFEGPVMGQGGYYYGTTNNGGKWNFGTVYRIKGDGSDFKKLFDFTSNTGGLSRLLAGADGSLYGTSGFGGNFESGTLYKINNDGTGYTILHHFGDAGDGIQPVYPAPIQGPDNSIYGLTSGGGPDENGTIYKIQPNGTGYTRIYDFPAFNASTVSVPNGNIILTSEGKLTGLTIFGGPLNKGAVYKINTDGTGYTNLHEYATGLGQYITEGPDQRLYGFESRGGANANGSMFRMNLDGTGFSSTNATFTDSYANYPFQWGDLIFVPAKEKQDISFEPIDIQSADNFPFQLTGIASSGLAVTYTSSDPSVASVSGNTVTIHNEGVTIITARQSGSTLFFEAQEVQQPLQVGKLLPVVRITTPSEGFVGSTIELTADTGGSDGEVTFSVLDATGTSTLVGNMLTLNSAGVVVISAYVDETDAYQAAAAPDVEFNIKKQKPPFAITSDATGAIGSTINLSSSKGQSTGTVTYTVTNLSGSAALSGNVLTPGSTPGSVRVDAMLTSDALYSSASTSMLITITSPVSQEQRIFGTTQSGGSGNGGTIYSTKTDGTDLRVIKEFLPSLTGNMQGSTLVKGTNNKFYGTMQTGGLYNSGVLFEFDQTEETYTVLYNFNVDDGYGGLCELTPGSNGKIYAMTAPLTRNKIIVYTVDPATRAVAKSAELPGVRLNLNPTLAETSNGIFVSVTGDQSQPKIIRFDATANTLTVVQDLDVSIVGFPVGSTITANGKTYTGMSSSGFGFKGGILEYNPTNNTSVLKVIFMDATGRLLNRKGLNLANGKIYFGLSGINNPLGAIAEYIPGATSVNVRADLSQEVGSHYFSLFSRGDNGKLYTVTLEGGANGAGTILEFDPVTFATKSVYDFIEKPVNDPGTFVLGDNEKLFSIRDHSEVNRAGSIYSFDPSTGQLQDKIILEYAHESSAPDGMDISIGSKLYGTISGFTGFGGGLFEFDTKTNKYRVALAITEYLPTPASLSLHPNGKIYGVKFRDNFSDQILFDYDPATGASTDILNFGDIPLASYGMNMVVTKAGKFYGLGLGGEDNIGNTYPASIFEFDLASKTITIKVELDESKGVDPGFLREGPDGNLYGFALSGGTNDKGTIFRFKPSDGTFAVIHEFNGTDGAGPSAAPYLAPNGKMYGYTRTGAANAFGGIFEYNITSEVLTVLHNFTEPNRSFFGAPMVMGSDNKLVGTMTSRTSDNRGYLYSLDLTSGQFIPTNFTGPNGSRPSGNMYLGKLPQTITFAALPSKAFNAADFDLTATSNSGLEVSYVSSNTSVATVTGKTVKIIGIGVTTITASQAGNESYNPATSVEQQLTVGKASQAITFDVIPAKELNSAPFDVTATASSSLAVSFSTTSDKITIASGKVTLVKAGKASIKADQAGNDFYSAAPPVTQEFCINPLSPVAQSSGTSLTSSADAGNQWYLNGTAITDATNKTLTATSSGSYSVKQTLEGCSSAASNNLEVVITGLEDLTEAGIHVYPNPAHHEFEVVVNGGDNSELSFELADMLGRSVSTRVSAFNKTERFDVSSQPGGLYYIKVKQNDRLIIKKIVIR